MTPLYRRVWIGIKGTKPKRYKRGWKRNRAPITTRSQWGARTTDKLERQPGAWKGSVTLVVHHTVTRRASAMTRAAGDRAVGIVQGVHAGNRGGIGYNYLASAGLIYEGRGFEVVAAAAFDSARNVGWNRGPYVHVAIPGNYTSEQIAPQDLRALDDLIVHLKGKGCNVTRIIGHSDLMPTACPGAQGRRDLAKHFGARWKGAK